jgi:hypothetical protein
MRDNDHKLDLEKKRELLERSANRTRERLIETLSALDDKRHELTDVKGLAKREVIEHKKPILITAGSLVGAVGAIVGYSIYRFATRRERLRAERWKALKRWWNHPERLARKNPPTGSVAAELGRKILIGSLTFAALELTKRSIRGALPEHKTVIAPTRVVVRTLPA